MKFCSLRTSNSTTVCCTHRTLLELKFILATSAFVSADTNDVRTRLFLHAALAGTD
jgi:hypothetical protein